MTRLVLGFAVMFVGALCIRNACSSFGKGWYYMFGLDVMMVLCMMFNLYRVVFDL